MVYGECSNKSTEQLMKRQNKLMAIIETAMADSNIPYKDEPWEKLHELLDIERELTLREGE